jgi:hypothetical protein
MEQLTRIEAKLTKVLAQVERMLQMKSILDEFTEAKRIERKKERLSAAARRAAALAVQNHGKIPLPRDIWRKDKRLEPLFVQWAQKGMEFGARNEPEEFAEWVVMQWNSKAYLKKPITFSGGYFQFWFEGSRYPITPYEMMNLSNKSRLLLKNDGDLVDFRDRKWWEWGYSVWKQVLDKMEELEGYDDLPERFLRCCKLLAGGYGEYEVYPDLIFDPNEDNVMHVNKCLRKIGPDLRVMWKACIRGLRSNPVS